MLIPLASLGIAIVGVVVSRFLRIEPKLEADRREAFADGVPKKAKSKNLAGMIMMIVITALLLPICLYMIITKGYGDDANNFSFGTIGVLVGYWVGFKRK